MTKRWDAFWYGEEAPFNLAVARMLLATSALWVILSRPGWPAQFEYPPAMWRAVEPELWLRFAFTGSVPIETALFVSLHVVLITAALGLWPRASSLAAGLLLYHFAPLETIFWSPNPYLRGLTIPCLGLLVLSFAPCAATTLFRSFGLPRSRACRWPLRLIQVFFCQIYLFSAWSKLYNGGPGWVTGENIRGWLIALGQILGWSGHAPAVDWMVGHSWLMAGMAGTGFLFDLLFPVILFFPRTRWVMVPMAVVFHLANAYLFHIYFHNLPLLLLFFDWKAAPETVE